MSGSRHTPKVGAKTSHGPRRQISQIPATLADWCRQQPEFDRAHIIYATLWSGYEAIRFTADAAVLLRKLVPEEDIIHALDYVTPDTKLAEYICHNLRRGLSRDLNDAFEIARLIKRNQQHPDPDQSRITMTLDGHQLLAWLHHVHPSIDTSNLEDSLSPST